MDFGILRHVHRFWPSDCNDALDRQRIHAGFLRLVPPEMMGAHVALPLPHHRPAPDDVAAGRTALFGHMGLELDVTALAEAEAEELAAFIALYKRHRGLIHGGRLVRLDGLEPGRIGYGAVARTAPQALFAIARPPPPPSASRRPSCCRALPPTAPGASALQPPRRRARS